MRILGTLSLLVASLASLAWVGCADGSLPRLARQREAQREQTRSTMAEILGALRVALPLALSGERFRDPANQEVIGEALDTLASHAGILESHGRNQEAGFQYLSRSLAQDSRTVAARFSSGFEREARFLLGQISEDCVACHSRLPSPEGSSMGQLLLAEVDIARLSPSERARLQVATRQFNDALLTYESLLRTSKLSPTRLDLEGLITDYLVLVIRVEDDLPRARHVLEAFGARPDLPRYLQRNVDAWTRDLAEIGRTPVAGPALSRARILIEGARRRSGYPMDRAVLIYDLVASGILNRYVAENPEPGPEVAEAYYLLGVAEARIRRSFWVSESEFYLETAIRMAPKADFASLAYARLEEETLAGYSGSSGLHLPADVLAKLEELRALVEGD